MILSLIIGLTHILSYSTVNFESIPDHSGIDSTFIAAKYSLTAELVDIMGDDPSIPSSIKSYTYYIQYGEQRMIIINDPGKEIEFFPVTVSHFDYQNNTRESTLILNHVGLFWTKKDSISLSIEKSKGTIESFCNQEKNIETCDSLGFNPIFSDHNYVLTFTDRIPNLRSYKLFYPDIKYLPSRIERLGKKKSTFFLEEIVYGKEVIDKLLSEYSHEGYNEITAKEAELLRFQFPPESYLPLLPDSLR